MSTVFDVVEKAKDRTVVRLSTSAWHDERGAYLKKSLTVLKRKSIGYNHLFEECSCAGAEDVLPKIIGIESFKDGVYELMPVNIHRDWETGYVDDWDLELIPYKDQP